MQVEQVITIAKDSGFEIAEFLDPGKLDFKQEIRDMCAPDKCQFGYGKCWSCPPAGIPLDELAEKAKKFSKGIIVQTVGQMKSSFDMKSVRESAKVHSKHFITLADKLLEVDNDIFPMGAGPCKRCEDCTYPDNPCRFPDKMITSMEASGLYVYQVCKDNEVPYHYGANTIAFCSCILFN